MVARNTLFYSALGADQGDMMRSDAYFRAVFRSLGWQQSTSDVRVCP